MQQERQLIEAENKIGLSSLSNVLYKEPYKCPRNLQPQLKLTLLSA